MLPSTASASTAFLLRRGVLVLAFLAGVCLITARVVGILIGVVIKVVGLLPAAFA